jgi:hypothetical protein
MADSHDIPDGGISIRFVTDSNLNEAMLSRVVSTGIALVYRADRIRYLFAIPSP